MNHTLGIIFDIVRRYSTTYPLPFVLSEVVRYMKDLGYPVTVLDQAHRNYKLLQVGGHTYRIVRNKGWTSYEVLAVD